jgi:hypothetical protein
LIGKGWRDRLCPTSYRFHAPHTCPKWPQIHVTSWKQTYVGQAPQGYLGNLAVARRLRLWQEPFPNRGFSGLLIAKEQHSGRIYWCGRARDEDRTVERDLCDLRAQRAQAAALAMSCTRTHVPSFKRVRLLRAYLWVLDTNHQAIAAYRRWSGVVEQGRLTGHAIGGRPMKKVSVLFNLV